jgi:protein-tyrosine phosphatase
MRTALFLCTGNYYRSRFAAILFEALVREHGLPWMASSRGLALSDRNVGPIAPDTVAHLHRLGIPVSEPRRPLPLTEGDLLQADLIIAMKEAEHRSLMQRAFPRWENAVEYWGIDDVDCAPPDRALAALQDEVAGLVARLLAESPSPVAS